MADKSPLKYESGTHTPFVPGDEIPAWALDLINVILPGNGIAVASDGAGGVIISNLCCDEPCVPNWQDTGTTRCIGEFQENLQNDGCGNTRWFVTSIPCEGPCVPNWQDTGTTRCSGLNVESLQIDGCGDSRWFDTGVPVTWTNNGAQFCSGEPGTYLQPQINQCGITRNFDTGVACNEPCVPNWQNTGTTRCTGDFLENFQEDGCGNSRWDPTATPSWSNTGVTRCSGANVENQQINACDSTTRWVDTGVPVAWVDNGESYCDGGTLKIPQVDQCGNTRIFDTGIACGGAPDLSWVWAALGCHARQSMQQGQELGSFITFGGDGSGSSGTSGTVSPINGSGTWLPAGESASNYEVRLDQTTSGCAPTTGTLGVWTPVGSGTSFQWRATATGNPTQTVTCHFQGTLRIRKIGMTEEETHSVDLELKANGQCF